MHTEQNRAVYIFSLIFLFNFFIIYSVSDKALSLNISIEYVTEKFNLNRNIPSFGMFCIKHVIDPAILRDHNSLNTTELNEIIFNRWTVPHNRTHGSPNLYKKSTHIFILSSPKEIKASFRKGPTPSLFNESNPITTVGMSDRQFHVIGLKKGNHNPWTSYLVWDCGLKYIEAGLNKFNEPIFLNGFQDSIVSIFPFPKVPVLNINECSYIS